MKPTKKVFTAMIVFLIMSGPIQAGTLTFGVYTSDKPTVMYQKFNPVMNYLENYFQQNKIQINIEMKIFPTYSGAITSLAKGEVDFARFGPASYILAKEKNTGIRLLCMEHKNGKKRFKGIFIARKNDDSIIDISDLNGKSFAFGNQNSTIGRYLSQAEMIKKGIKAADLDFFKFLGRHDKVALAVAAGNYDAGVVKENTFDKYSQKKGLKKIGVFPNVTKPWVVRYGLDQSLYDLLKSGLLALRDDTILKGLKQHGFLQATDHDYDFVRKGMILSREFE